MALKFKQKYEILAQNCVFLLSAVTLAPNVHIIRIGLEARPSDRHRQEEVSS